MVYKQVLSCQVFLNLAKFVNMKTGPTDGYKEVSLSIVVYTDATAGFVSIGLYEHLTFEYEKRPQYFTIIFLIPIFWMIALCRLLTDRGWCYHFSYCVTSQ